LSCHSPIVAGVLAAAALAIAPPAIADGIAGQFDFYVLSMSWTERPCADDEDDYDEILCAAGKHGFDFVSLAPRHEAGAPAACSTLMPTDLSEETLLETATLMSKASALEEWAARGVCAGLRADDYFALARDAVAAVAIPPDLVRPGVPDRLTPSQIIGDFTAANPRLVAEGLAVDCYRGVFTGIKVCMTKDLDFRPCEEVHALSCQGDPLVIPEIE